MTRVTIDLTDETTANESRAALAALEDGKLGRLMRLVRAAVSDVNDTEIVATIRSTLADEYWWVSGTGEHAAQPDNPDLPSAELMPLPIGVTFTKTEDDDYLAGDGLVVFEDGRVEEIRFDLDELFTEEFGHRTGTVNIAVDLRTGQLHDDEHPHDHIRERFEIKPTPNEWSAATVLAGIRTALAAEGANPAPVSVVFPCSDDGFLLPEDARVTYADGSSRHVDLSVVSTRLTNDYSYAAAGRPLVVDLLVDAVTYFAG
jgi:hypothetical protein